MSLNKYLLSLFFSCAITNNCASALSTDGFNSEEVKGEITFFCHRTDLVDTGVYRRYAEEFKKKFPNVTNIKVEAFSDYQGALLNRLKSHDYGDVILILPSIPANKYEDFYEPLDDLYYGESIYFHDSWVYANHSYGISMGNACEGLVYNKAVFKEAGVEVPIKTVDELLEACEKIKKIQKIPIYINFGAQWPLQQWDKYPLVVAGQENVYEKMLNENSPFASEGAPFNFSLKLLKKLISSGYTESDLTTNNWSDSKTAFAKGEVGMMYLGSWVIPQLIKSGADSDNIGMMPIPSNNDGFLYAHISHDWAYAVSKYSKNKETAKAFIKFLLEESDYEHISGYIPTVCSRPVILTQISEYMSYKNAILVTPINSSEFISTSNRSGIDFFSGGYIQKLMNGDDFEGDLLKLDRQWNIALKQNQ